MLNEYLQFSSESSKEQTEEFEFNKLIEEIISNFNNKMIQFNRGENFNFNGRKISIQRCLNNIIDNSIKYGQNILISLNQSKNNILITIDDDGPGIPENEKENVFKPFYKIDKSRAHLPV